MGTRSESFCDVCGKTLYDGGTAPWYEYFTPRVKHTEFNPGFFWKRKRLDVCNLCWEKFKEWVKD